MKLFAVQKAKYKKFVVKRDILVDAGELGNHGRWTISDIRVFSKLSVGSKTLQYCELRKFSPFFTRWQFEDPNASSLLCFLSCFDHACMHFTDFSQDTNIQEKGRWKEVSVV
jgi:hypothetical protein